MDSFKMPVAVARFANSRFDIMTLAARRLAGAISRCSLSWLLTGGCRSQRRLGLFRSPQFRHDRATCDTTGDDRRTKERAFQPSFAVDANQPGQFTDGVQAGNRAFLRIQRTARTVNQDSAHALACDR